MRVYSYFIYGVVNKGILKLYYYLVRFKYLDLREGVVLVMALIKGYKFDLLLTESDIHLKDKKDNILKDNGVDLSYFPVQDAIYCSPPLIPHFIENYGKNLRKVASIENLREFYKANYLNNKGRIEKALEEGFAAGVLFKALAEDLRFFFDCCPNGFAVIPTLTKKEKTKLTNTSLLDSYKAVCKRIRTSNKSFSKFRKHYDLIETLYAEIEN